jgi:hypothetical protein
MSAMKLPLLTSSRPASKRATDRFKAEPGGRTLTRFSLWGRMGGRLPQPAPGHRTASATTTLGKSDTWG